MHTRNPLPSYAAAAWLLLCLGCGDAVGSSTSDVVDVPTTAEIERQAIGNCWLYAHANWVETLHLSATGKQLDVSQSFWTYWHWYEQIVANDVVEDVGIEPGGSQQVAMEITRSRGLMSEGDFVPEDLTAESSSRQLQALHAINRALVTGALSDSHTRRDRRAVRQALDDAWELDTATIELLDDVFGLDGDRSLEGAPSPFDTPIVSAEDLDVQYTAIETTTDEEGFDDEQVVVRRTSLATAMGEWNIVSYPQWTIISSLKAKRRKIHIRMQRALHDGQPVMISAWLVDFNAHETSPGDLAGSFNLDTLRRAGGPGLQGSHSTLVVDYEGISEQYGLQEVDSVLDPSDPGDKAILDSLLAPDSEVVLFRIKNSWGSLRPPWHYAPGKIGYNDLYLNYLGGPINWCPDTLAKNAASCPDDDTPLQQLMLPPGY